MTLIEHAYLFKDMTCDLTQKTVLNLYGGGSIVIAIPSKNIAVRADRSRHLGNILTMQPKI